jgi:rhodanese-related sulfurtransferase
MQDITPRELDARMRRGELSPLLLDVREPWEIQICRLPDAETIPMRLIPSSLDTLDRTRPVVVICHHGVRSRQVAQYLAHHGFEQVLNLQGGVDAWARDVDTSMPTY